MIAEAAMDPDEKYDAYDVLWVKPDGSMEVWMGDIANHHHAVRMARHAAAVARRPGHSFVVRGFVSTAVELQTFTSDEDAHV